MFNRIELTQEQVAKYHGMNDAEKIKTCEWYQRRMRKRGLTDLDFYCNGKWVMTVCV